MDAKHEGGGGAKNQNSMLVLKSEAICRNDDHLMMAPEPVKEDGGDTTECSSSFGGTCSGFEDEGDDGELEVNSGVSTHANLGGPSKPPRRKKVTTEWRNYIRPILWRCQWLELHTKELSSQVSMYDRELALIKKQKDLQQAVSKANGTVSGPMRIDKGHRNSIMKRRKRTRHEENVCASFYIKKHQILSYYHDKQKKGAETDGPLIGDDRGSTAGSIRGGLDTFTLLDYEDYDMIFEQLTLTIDGIQSRVHLLQDCLSKVHSEGENLAFSEDNTDVRVAWKRQHTQKLSSSYTECQYTKSKKKRNLNILLKDNNGPGLAGKPALPERETDAHVKDADGNAEERSGECSLLREKAITVDLLLGTDSSIPNDRIVDLCKKDTDDILIDNQAANETCRQFGKVKYLPSGTSSKGQNISSSAETKNISAPTEVKNTCAPVKAEGPSAPAVKEPVSPGNKQDLKPKKKRKKGTYFTKKQRKEASKTPAAKEKTEGTLSASNNQTGSMPAAVAKEKSESTPSATTGPDIIPVCSAGKKRKSGDEPADTTKHEFGNLFASKEQKTGRPSSALKKQKTECSSAAAKKPETESAPTKLKIEKAVWVAAVNSRRSQRVRKPKVFTG